MQDRRLLYLVSEDWYFRSHRMSLACAARAAGWEVAVATRVRDDGERIRAAGLRLLPIPSLRGLRNPAAEAAAVLRLVRLYRRERPTLVHHVALKPALYGALAARAAGVPAVVNTFGGLGFVFASTDWRARLLRPAVRAACRALLDRENTRLIVQTGEDRDMLLRARAAAPERIRVIRGSGVDLDRFRPAAEPEGPPVVAMVSRMLWDKGVGVLVEAARILRRRGVRARVALVGRPDPANPMSIPESRLRAWHGDGAVEWWGYREDIPRVWAEARIAVLPTHYGEGIPKALLEAAACGRPIVATDTPGCREIVRDGETGLLVPVRQPQALADALQRLIGDAGLGRRMGAAGRALVEQGFSEAAVNGETLDVYEELLASVRSRR